MVDITPQIPASRQVIQAYGDGAFRVSGVRHEGSVIVLPERTLAWPVAELSAVTAQSLSEVVQAVPKVDLLLLGCGRRPAPASPELRAALRAQGIVLEIMDTGAACRTYNILLSEERRIAAALIALR